MTVYRVSSTRFIRDITGTGAMLTGGRWNKRGVPVVYTSETRAGAILEFLVHAQQSVTPSGISIIGLQIPDLAPDEIAADTLPEDWRDFPAPEELADRGSAWAAKKQTLTLRVPSVIVPHEFNLLLNPLHKEFSRVKILEPENLELDRRLFV